MPLHSAVVVALGVLFVSGLAVNVSRLRVKLGIFRGYGDSTALEQAARVHLNTLEHLLPLCLALVVLELLGAPTREVDALGLSVLLSRVGYAAASFAKLTRARQLSVVLCYLLELVLPLLILARVLAPRFG